MHAIECTVLLKRLLLHEATLDDQLLHAVGILPEERVRLAVRKTLPTHVVSLRPVIIDWDVISQILIAALVSCRVLLVDSLGRIVYNIYLVAHKHLLLLDITLSACVVVRVSRLLPIHGS